MSIDPLIEAYSSNLIDFREHQAEQIIFQFGKKMKIKKISDTVKNGGNKSSKFPKRILLTFSSSSAVGR